jgi:Protein of unknown function (DUF998)
LAATPITWFGVLEVLGMKLAETERPQIRGLGLVAAAGPVVFAIGWVVGAATQTGFRVLRDGESALAAIGADHPWITVTGDTILGIGIIALAIALAVVLSGNGRTIGCVILALAGVCTIIQALVREDCVADLGFCTAAGRSDATTWRQVVHDSTSGVSFLAILVAAFVLAGALRRNGWTTLATYSTATAAVGGVLLAFFVVVSDSAIGGLAELLFLLAALGWVTILGLRVSVADEPRW